MRLNIIAATSASKSINKARVTGKFSLVAVAKINLLHQSLKFAKEFIDSDKEEYKDKYQLLVNKLNTLTNSCPDIICNIREVGCSSDEYENGFNINNPFNPIAPEEDPIIPEETNDPPTIDDNTISVDNNVTTVLTLEMFTTDANYSDPEGDLLDAIRVDKIYSNNLGVFYVNDVQIVEGQIISRELIDAGSFTHVGANVQTIQKDGFEFSVRDEGSGTWVQ
jgi:hypothetical protein